MCSMLQRKELGFTWGMVGRGASVLRTFFAHSISPMPPLLDLPTRLWYTSTALETSIVRTTGTSPSSRLPRNLPGNRIIPPALLRPMTTRTNERKSTQGATGSARTTLQPVAGRLCIPVRPWFPRCHFSDITLLSQIPKYHPSSCNDAKRDVNSLSPRRDPVRHRL